MVRAGLDWFLLALLGMIGLAYLWPEPGIQEGIWSLDTFADAGVSLIFFFYGLKLSPDKLRAGLTNWRLHLTIHLTTFVLFPVVVYAARPFFRRRRDRTALAGCVLCRLVALYRVVIGCNGVDCGG